MKYVAAYALLVLGGKQNPTAADLKAMLNEIGAQVDEAQLKEVVTALSGKNLADIIAAGMKQVATLSVGGGAAPQGFYTAQGNAPAAQQQAKPAEKPVEKVEEPEEDVDMGGLFD